MDILAQAKVEIDTAVATGTQKAIAMAAIVQAEQMVRVANALERIADSLDGVIDDGNAMLRVLMHKPEW